MKSSFALCSDDTLSHHCISNLEEACNISTDHHVAGLAALDGSLEACLEDALHDALELCIDFFKAPVVTDGVLAHLKTGGSNAACVGSLARSVEQACCVDSLDCLEGQRHVCTFKYCECTVCDNSLCTFKVHLVLRCARHGDVALYIPDVLAAFDILRTGNLVSVDGDASSSLLLDVKQDIEVDAVGVVDVAL